MRGADRIEGNLRGQQFEPMNSAVAKAQEIDRVIKIFNEEVLKASKNLEEVLDGTHKIVNKSVVVESAEKIDVES